MRLLRELVDYMRVYRRWWITPIVIALLLVGALVALSAASPLSPFIYPLF